MEGEDRALLRKFRGLACDVLADAEALGPGRALEWVAALETATVHYSALPPARKRRFNLTMRDTGIDALAVDGRVAVQAKDYNGTVPLHRLTNFHFCAKVRSRLPPAVELLVATTNRTRLAPTWVETGVARHLRISRARIEQRLTAARRLRRLRQLQGSAARAWHDRDVRLWPHQQECLEKCEAFYRESARRDFFAEVATAAGKTGIYAELLERLRPRRACIVVPRVDLMEDFWRLYRPDAVRVGTGHNGDENGVDSDAELYVCVRDSAWRLGNLTFDLVIFDEAHHYEPPPQDIDAELEKLWMIGHRGAVLSLKARKRFFFSATLRYHHLSPDFRFTLREAIDAGRVADYDITVPIVSEGDAKPCLARLLRQSPHFRRLLAFCNTEREADRFAALLRDEGVPAELYSGRTSKAERQRLDADFASGELRALVTCRVLGEGRDVPSADTCVFVEPRSSRVDVAQCIGRVLRLQGKTVAHVVAPAHSQRSVFELWFAALMEAMARYRNCLRFGELAGHLIYGELVTL